MFKFKFKTVKKKKSVLEKIKEFGPGIFRLEGYKPVF